MFSDYQSYSHKKITMTRRLCLLMALVLTPGAAFAQGVGIPTKRAGIGFGNLARFTGIRLNFGRPERRANYRRQRYYLAIETQ